MRDKTRGTALTHLLSHDGVCDFAAEDDQDEREALIFRREDRDQDVAEAFHAREEAARPERARHAKEASGPESVTAAEVEDDRNHRDDLWAGDEGELE